ncbi:hypothetical protein GCM10011316_29490 [Roseibium aquae]|uniref:DUF2460 domain-containing protein n=1 Tax=Roseibium aquae TaxID=1323746 RepID=A0A916TP05_9HYPH|nr:DUF2460 domain-containing protein [Roseibium aquae]GGB55509.1 hypothetical protein GCM10011316_29490 [Roseibium aquae]
MTDFDEVRFPDVVARGALGGPERRTEIVELTSGFEERNTPWADSRRKYDVGSGIRHPDHLSEVIAFFEARSGRLRGFRFKDWADFTSSRPSAPVTPFDQVLGAADGSQTSFQLIKAYSSGSRSWIRRIAKPVAGTVLIAVDGAVQASGWSVDPANGIVTFDAAPAMRRPCRRRSAGSRAIVEKPVTYGTRTIVIPARPYLGFSDADRAEILALAEAHFEAAAGEGRA